MLNDDGPWRKAAKSDQGNCAEVRRRGDRVQVRDSKLGDASPVLSFTFGEWDAFKDGFSRGEFDIA